MIKSILALLLLPVLAFAAVEGLSNPVVEGLSNPVVEGVSGTPDDVIVRPSSNYSTLNDFAASAGQKYECVDEETPNGDDDYIYKTDASSGQGFDNLPTLPDGTILGVAVYVVAKEIGGDTTIRPRLYTGDNVTNGAPTAQNITTSYAEYSYEWTTNPATSEAWTKAEVEGTDETHPLVGWGFYSAGIDAGETTRVTQVYLVVRYNE